MSKYYEYDARLLKAIANGAGTMTSLNANKDLQRLAEPHRAKDRWGHMTEYYRIVDRRLQALRKAEKIQFLGGRWRVIGKS